MVHAERTLAELKAVQAHLSRSAGFRILTSDIDVAQNHVLVDVVTGNPQMQAALDARFGTGTVQVSAALNPVS